MSARDSQQEPLGFGTLVRFWAPLATTWLMMAVDGPFLAAVIARLPDPKYNLAAWGVAFAVALIIEAPIIMILSAATALVRDRDSLRKLRNYTYAWNGILTAAMLLLVLTPAWSWVADRMLGLPETVTERARGALLILTPWAPAIGYRRFFQGLMIRDNLTRMVAYGTVVRVLAMIGTALALFPFFRDGESGIPGVYVGAAAMCAGVVAGAVATRWMAIGTVRKLRATPFDPDLGEERLTYRRINAFYYPLALTSMIGLAVHPMVTFFIGHARMAIESLAVLPVIHALSFIFRSLALSYQEVAITMLARDERNYPLVARFSAMLAAGVAVGMALVAFSPLGDVWFRNVSGLTDELARFAVLPTRIMALMPALSVLLVMQRSVLVHRRETVPITWATAIELAGIAAAMAVGILWLDLVGAVVATGALIVGRVMGNLYLMPPWRRALAPIPRD
ncbi:hypothetical protein ABI59_11060 [Acidobacteria bacterium Mor1]|nr:hypothetical protein ABI59_11060 [Acidobacteria bacterium Mor1]